ncbi:MAG: hypothetical protein ACLTC4_07885 [Hungatella hathewayi]
MSHFILHKKLKGKKLSCLLAGIGCVLVAAVVCYVANSMGTVRAKSRETVLIYTEEELEQYLLDQENEEYNLNGRYRLEEDLELDWLYQSIGNNIEPFTGAFDGNGHVISGLGRPLFGVVEGAEIENLFLSEALIEHPFTYYDGEGYVDGYGVLAALAVDSSIKNCGISGEIYTASPSEAEYQLAKGSLSDTDEQKKGPGMEEEIEAEGSLEDIETGGAGGGPGTGMDTGIGDTSREEEENGPDSTEPDSTEPDSTVPDSTVPESTVSDSTVPDSTVPESSHAGELETETSGSISPEETGSLPQDSNPSEPSENQEAADTAPETSQETKAPSGEDITGNAESTVAGNNPAAGSAKEQRSESETIGYRPMDRQKLMMKTADVVDSNMEAFLTASPSDATPSDAEETPGSPDGTKPEEVPEEELEYIGNPNGDLYILVTAERVAVGGLVAQTAGTSLLADSFALVTIGSSLGEIPTYAGGFTGIIGQETVAENSYAAGLVENDGVSGGFTAVNDGTVQNSYSTVTIGNFGTVRGAFTAAGTGNLSGCVYDRQMACVEAEEWEAEEQETEEWEAASPSDAGPSQDGQDEELPSGFELMGLDTIRMTGADAQIPGTWYRTEHAYPQTVYFSEIENETARSYSRASVIALVLPEGNTLAQWINSGNIVLPPEIDGEAIQWDTEGNAEIDDLNQVVIGPGATVSMYDVRKHSVCNGFDSGEASESTETKAFIPQEEPLPGNQENNGSGTTENSEVKLKATIGGISRNYAITARTEAVATLSTYSSWAVVGEELSQNGTTLSGGGTTADPYQIGSAPELALFAYLVNQGNKEICAMVTDNLDMFGGIYNTNTTVSPGNALQWIPMADYQGTFDGGGHSLTNLKLESAGEVGLIGSLGNQGIVKNIGVDTASISATANNAGAIVGHVTGANCQIIGCWNRADIRGRGNLGGVVGGCEGGGLLLEGCFNTGRIDSTGKAEVGGVCGGFRTEGNNIVRNCYNRGAIVGGEYTGGVLASCYAGVIVQNCFNASTVRGNFGTGGVGAKYGTYSNCYYDKQLFTGAGIGYSGSGSVLGMTTAQSKSWYLAYKLNEETLDGGWKYNPGDYPSFGVLEPCDWEKAGEALEVGLLPTDKTKPTVGDGAVATPYEIENAEQLAWFMYQVNKGSPALCAKLMNDIDLRGSAYDGIVGAPFRWIPMGTSTSPYTGTFDGNGRLISYMKVEQEGSAGLFGYMGGGAVIKKAGLAPTSSVKNTSADDTVEKGTAGFAGAVVSVGGNAGITIQNCYNRAKVEGRTGSRTGAFVGACEADAVNVQLISNSYTTGLITGISGSPGAIAGNFAAYNAGTGAGISHCFWDSETSVASGTLEVVSGGGAGSSDTGPLTSAAMNTAVAETSGGLLERLNAGMSNLWQRRDSADGELMNDGYPIIGSGYDSWADIGCLDSFKPSLKTPSNTATAGQQANPYQIKTAAELAWFAYQVNNVAGQSGICGELKADISLFGEQYTGSTYVPGDTAGLSRALNWIPIGYSMGTTPYTGIFQGNGHTVSDMRAQGLPDMVSVGLFGSIGTGAGIYDLALSNAQLLVTGSSGGAAGGITGMIEGNGAVIKNCRNTGSLTFARTNGGTVLVGGGGITGGIDASAAGVVIKSCWNAGNIRNENTRYSGGIVGLCSTGGLQLEGCYTTAGSRVGDQADVNGQYAGGIIGGFATTASGSELKVKNCYNWGTVDGRNTAGGIIGNVGSSLNGQTIMNCYNTGTVTVPGGDNKGAIIGSGTNADAASNCYYDKTLWDSSGGGGGAGIHGIGLGTEVMKSWAAAYALNGQSRSQGTGADDISWTYDPVGTSYPTLAAEGLPPAESWDQIGMGLENGLITHDSTGFVWTKPGGTAGTGDGSEGNPYLLASAEDLAWFAYMVNHDYAGYSGKCIRLETDINLFGKPYTGYTGSTDLANITSALQWKPIGGNGKPYKGTFDGGRHEIDGMYIRGDAYLGLFGAIQYPAKIRQLGIGASSKTISTGNNSALLAGCIITVSGGGCEITDCYNLGTLQTGGWYVGAFVGDDVGSNFSGTISNCYNAGATARFARIDYGKIENCYADTEKNSSNAAHDKASGNGVTSMTTAQMKTNEPVTGLNTLGSGGTLRTGTDRVWYTSLDSETTKGYPTLKAPTVMTVEFAQDTPVDGSSVTLKDSGGNPVTITGMKLRSFGLVDDTFTPGSTAAAGAEFTMVPYAGTAGATGVDAGVTGADSNYHKYGYTNANQNLGFLAGTVDLNGKTESLNATSLSVPVDVGLGNVSSVSLGRAAAYTKPEDRYVLLEAAGGPSGTSRYEIQMTVKGAIGKTLSVTLPIKVTMANLTPDGTDHTVSGGTADYSLDLKITNHNACPIDGKILGAEINETAGYAKLQPVLPSYTLSHTGNLTDAGGGVRVGLADVGGASPAVIGAVKYYDKDAAPGTAWMKYRLKHGGYLPYRYVMEYSGLHFGPETQFGYKISYWFGVSADDYDSTANAVVTS